MTTTDITNNELLTKEQNDQLNSELGMTPDEILDNDAKEIESALNDPEPDPVSPEDVDYDPDDEKEEDTFAVLNSMNELKAYKQNLKQNEMEE